MLPLLPSPPRPQLMLLLPTALLLLLLHCTILHCQAGAEKTNHLCDGEQLRSILSDVDLASCLAETGLELGSSNRECSVMRHFESLAKKRGQSLDEFMSYATVLIFAHSEFASEITEPDNPVLDMAQDLAPKNAFIAVAKCLKMPNSTCQKLRFACYGGFVSHFVFMVSGHCSKSWGCAPVYASEKSQPSSLVNVLPYIQYRLLERQAFVAKEKGELQLGTSTHTEYLVQTELNDTYGSQLVSKNSRPVAMFVAGKAKSLAYYEQLSSFLDAAIRLKHLFSFHIVVTPLSKLTLESDRPPYRWKFEDHESFVALYTKRLCASSSSTWTFTCKPHLIRSVDMLLSEQYASFLLHKVLSEESSGGAAPYPALGTTNAFLKEFVHASSSYVLAVVPVDEMLTDPMVKWDIMQALASYLGSSFNITYHPIIVTKSVAVELLKGLNTGLNLEQTFYHPCFFIRFPTKSYAVLKMDEPIAVLDKTVREAAKESEFQIRIQTTQEYFNEQDSLELPGKMRKLGHIVGALGNKPDDDFKEMAEEIQVQNLTDAFSEQMKFNDVYNVTGVLVVESNPALMRDFFTKLGQDKPWLTLFTVSWSPLCKAARAAWSSVGQCARRLGFPDVQLVKVDCYEANEICRKLNVTTYPTVSMFSRGIQLNTYTGPIISSDLCLYAKLAFEPPVLSSNSEKETQEILDKLLTIKSRAFVLRGQQVPNQLTAVAKSLRFREVFVHEKAAASGLQLRAVYRDVRPNLKRYTGSPDDSEGILNFVLNGHLSSVFPCTWAYLPQALKLERPLTILFHVGAADNALLDHLHAKLSDRTALCQLNLRNFTHLHDMVQRLAGLSMPSLVVLAAKPAGSANRVSYRLALGTLPAAELPDRAVDWLDKALSHRLPDATPLEPVQKWQPASQVFNFVDQVYHGKQDDAGHHRSRGSRAFSLDATADQKAHGDEDGAARTVGSMESSLGQGKGGSGSMRDEL